MSRLRSGALSAYTYLMILPSSDPLKEPVKHAAGCFIEARGKVLLLRRHPEKIYGSLWCLPGGMLEEGESAELAMQRELLEETGVRAATPDVQFLTAYHIRYPDADYVWNQFLLQLEVVPNVTLSAREHTDYCWKKPAEILEMANLMEDLGYVLEQQYRVEERVSTTRS